MVGVAGPRARRARGYSGAGTGGVGWGLIGRKVGLRVLDYDYDYEIV